MRNQTSGQGGTSGKVQAIVSPGSKKSSGKGSAAGSSKGKSGASAGAAVSSGGSGAMVPNSVKGPHVKGLDD
jgi:hypothetical protein